MNVNECVLSHSVMSNSLQSHGLYPIRLLCPWNSPGKNTGVGCHFLLQGIFRRQGSNHCLLDLLHFQADSLPQEPPGKPITDTAIVKNNSRDFSGGPAVKTLPSNAGGAGSIPGLGAKIPHVLWPQNKKQSRNNIVTNSIETLKMVHIKKKNFKKKNNLEVSINNLMGYFTHQLNLQNLHWTSGASGDQLSHHSPSVFSYKI